MVLEAVTAMARRPLGRRTAAAMARVKASHLGCLMARAIRTLAQQKVLRRALTRAARDLTRARGLARCLARGQVKDQYLGSRVNLVVLHLTKAVQRGRRHQQSR